FSYADSCHSAVTSRPFLAEKRQHEKTVARPPRHLLNGPTARQPMLGLALVLVLDRQRRKPVVAREEELRLTELLRERERLAILRRASHEVSAALVDLREDDDRDRQMSLLPEPAIELDGGLGRFDPFI